MLQEQQGSRGRIFSRETVAPSNAGAVPRRDGLTYAWRIAVKVVLFLVVFEGVLRKWIFPEATSLLYFAKDFVFLVAFGCYLLSQRPRWRTRHSGGFVLWGLGVAGLVSVSAMVVAGDSPATAIFGLKVYLFYIPLAIMVGHLFDNTEALLGFLEKYSWLAIPACLLGMVQFAAPTDSVLNRYTEDIGVATFGEVDIARITGPFSYISGHVVYLQTLTPFLLVMGAIVTNPRKALMFSLILALVLINVVMSGSRALALIALLTIGGLFLTCGLRAGRESGTLRKMLVGGVLLFALAFASLASVREAVWAFGERMENAGDSFIDRAFQHHESFSAIIASPPFFGYGPSITHPGSAALRAALEKEETPTDFPELEAEWARVVWEIGAIAAACWYGFRLYVLFALWQVAIQMQDTRLRFLGFAAFIMHALSLPGSVVLNHTMTVYYWFFAGFIFLLPRLDSPPPATAALSPWRRDVREAFIGSSSRSS